jgi:alpha-ribazole phosphatase
MRLLSRLHGGTLIARLILVRHTQLAVDPGVCYGRTDLDLAPTWPLDFEQCLSCIPPNATHILSSPLIRCLGLAHAIGRRDQMQVQVDERLQELDFGAWESRPWGDIPRECIEQWASDPLDYAPGNGECLRTLWARVGELRTELIGRVSGNVIIVSHHGPLRALAAQAAGQPMEAIFTYRIPWGGVLCVELEY